MALQSKTWTATFVPISQTPEGTAPAACGTNMKELKSSTPAELATRKAAAKDGREEEMLSFIG
jgi:hypothetical protein